MPDKLQCLNEMSALLGGLLRHMVLSCAFLVNLSKFMYYCINSRSKPEQVKISVFTKFKSKNILKTSVVFADRKFVTLNC